MYAMTKNQLSQLVQQSQCITPGKKRDILGHLDRCSAPELRYLESILNFEQESLVFIDKKNQKELRALTGEYQKLKQTFYHTIIPNILKKRISLEGEKSQMDAESLLRHHNIL